MLWILYILNRNDNVAIHSYGKDKNDCYELILIIRAYYLQTLHTERSRVWSFWSLG